MNTSLNKLRKMATRTDAGMSCFTRTEAEALASYAKQMGDTQLRKMADRIHGRATRRVGELLKQIQPAKNQYDASNTRAKDGSVPRTEAATNAGLSERQRKTALRVATIPEQDFNEAIDSNNPPNRYALGSSWHAIQAEADFWSAYKPSSGLQNFQVMQHKIPDLFSAG